MNKSRLSLVVCLATKNGISLVRVVESGDLAYVVQTIKPNREVDFYLPTSHLIMSKIQSPRWQELNTKFWDYKPMAPNIAV